MRKIPGVTAATVSLNEGVVILRFAPSNRVTVDRIRETIRSNGFSPKGAEVRINGRIEARGDTVTLVVPETNEALLVEAESSRAGNVGELRRLPTGTRVAITGIVPESPKKAGRQPLRLVVHSFAPVQASSGE